MKQVAGRVWMGATVVAVGLLLVARSASSAPPPPRFWDFRVQNQTGATVKNISIELHSADANTNYGTLEAQPIVLNVSRLPAGKTLVIGSGAGTSGLYGVAKIVVRAECPDGKSLTSPVSITAPMGQYQPATPNQEYSAFCEEAPSGQPNHVPGVVFRPASRNGYEAWLHAHARWHDFWSPLREDTKPFTP